jgi:hypothetical protein
MVMAKPPDKREPPPIRHSGHGAASLIPHLKGKTPITPPEADDAASAEDLTKAPPTAPLRRTRRAP